MVLHQPTTTMEKLPLPKSTYSTGKTLEIHKGTWLPVALAFMYRFNNYNYRSSLMASLFGGLWYQLDIKKLYIL